MSFLYSGGGERVVLEQAKRLRERGHKVRVFAPIVRWEKSFPELLSQVKPERIVPSVPVPLPVRDALAMIASAVLPFRMREMADCDVLLCHSQPSMWLGYRVHGLFGTPYVGYLHQLTTFIHARPADAGSWQTKSDFLVLDRLLGGYSFRRTVTKHLDRLCHLSASCLLFNSAWTRSLFQREYGVSGDVCYPGLDATEMTQNRGWTRENMILTASRHYPWKRIDLAFQVLSKLRCKPQLVVVGESTRHTPYLRSVVRQLKLEDRVKFTGFVTDDQLQQFYRHASGYVQTSIYEPFGLGPLEAQLAGTPAVVWGDAGVRETVVDGETGFHAKPYDVDDFADKVNLILSSPGKQREMSRAAKIWASTFGWDTHIDLLEGVLDEERQ